MARKPWNWWKLMHRHQSRRRGRVRGAAHGFRGERAQGSRLVCPGSVKSQIGHTKGRGRAAGLFKAVMALHHRVLPSTIKVDRPDPKLNVDESPFCINTMARPWVRDRRYPRRASVSSFGFGDRTSTWRCRNTQAQAGAPGGYGRLARGGVASWCLSRGCGHALSRIGCRGWAIRDAGLSGPAQPKNCSTPKRLRGLLCSPNPAQTWWQS